MDDTNEEWKIMPYFILASRYWLPDYMKDYEIQQKKALLMVFYTK